MATDWHPESALAGLTAGIASLSLYQNLYPPAPAPPPSSQRKMFTLSKAVSSLWPRRDDFAIVVKFGNSFRAITSVLVVSDANCLRTVATLESVQVLPSDAGLRTIMILLAVAPCGPISRDPRRGRIKACNIINDRMLVPYSAGPKNTSGV